MNFHIAEFQAAYGLSRQLPPSAEPEIVFSGRSNVGKSSLINKLLYRKSIARVSATPGKTATINFFSLNGAKLVDLPGYGYAKVSQSEKKRWAELVEGYFAQERDIRLIVQICDMRHRPSDEDMDMLRFLENSGLNYIVAMTKMDKLKPTQKKQRLEEIPKELAEFPNLRWYACSSENGEGVDTLRTLIEQAVEGKAEE